MARPLASPTGVDQNRPRRRVLGPTHDASLPSLWSPTPMLKKIGRVLTRLVAALGALLAAAGLAIAGLVLLLTGVIFIQQTLSRFVGVGVKLGDVFAWSGRAMVLIGKGLGAADAVAGG